MNTLSPGATLQNGKYRIERVLGQGGFGITYLATQPLMLDRKVCIKEFFLKDYFSREATTSHVTCATESTREMTQTYRRKFIKEAQLQLQMHHESLVEVYDIFEENDTAYYAMEFIEGESLLEMVKYRGALPEAEAVGYIRQVADALAFIHSHQIAHLDVKPGNILIDKNGVAKLIDFGTSKHYDAKTGTQTTIATPCYSPGYAPIEQYKTGGLSTFSPESDVYSLGATLYKLVTGQTPPEPSEIVSDGLPELPGNISRNTQDTIAKAMIVASNKRMQNIKQFLDILYGQESLLTFSNASSSISTHPTEDTRVMTNVVNNIITEKESNLFHVKKETEDTKNNHKGETSTFSILWNVFSAVIIAVLTLFLVNLNQKNDELQQKYETLNVHSKARVKELENIISKVASSDIIISDIQVQNANEGYGKRINHKTTTYLNPKITVTSLVSGSADIYIKLYAPYGLSIGDSSPSGYSTKDNINVKKHKTSTYELSGWGSKEKGHWSTGKYRYEFYYKSKCIGTKTFQIY